MAKSVSVFASLSIHNYRLFFFGGLLSNVGTWMARVAQDWLVLTILTAESSMALGLTTALQFLPVLLMAPWAGAVADRFPKRRVLMVTQAGMMATGLALAGLTLGGVAALWHVYVLAFVSGIFGAFDAPARQAFAPEMVPEHLIPNAVGLNTTSFNAARLIGPALAGVMIAWWGVGPALLINGLSFLPVIGALALMRPGELHSPKRVLEKHAVRDGLRYVSKRPDLMTLMFIVFMLGTFGMNFQVTNALAAKVTFGVGSEEYGYLGSVMAIGSLSAGLLAAKRTQPRLRWILLSMVGFAVATALLAAAPNYWFYAIVLAPTGFACLTVMTSCNASVQLGTTPRMRGRVMAIYMAIFQGGTPIGAPLIGWVGDALGPRWTLAVGSIAAAVTVVLVVLYVLARNGWDWPRLRARPDEIPLDSIHTERH
ncbi:MAG: MFS transporter [Propionibacteriaceae bacterium]|jgi:MFS family permease|nr:MFS transporter [Propionibacteriaceae bacterium]